MNLDNLIRELRVDWEDLLTEETNNIPLQKYTDTTKFRNIYHKVEQAMDIIVDRSYDSFSNALLSYSTAHKEIKKNIEILENQINFCDEVLQSKLNFEIDEKGIKNELWLQHICTVILEIKNMIINIDNAILHRNGVYSAQLIKKVSALYNEYKLDRVKCLSMITQAVEEKKRNTIACLCADIDAFLVGKQPLTELKGIIDAAVMIDGLKKIDLYIGGGMEILLSGEYKAILDDHTNKEDLKITAFDIAHVTSRFYSRAVAVASYAFGILGRGTKNFFGMEEPAEKYIFTENYETSLSIRIFRVFKEVVSLCAFEEINTEIDNVFKLDDVVENINYFEYFDSKFDIAQRMITTGNTEATTRPKLNIQYPPEIESLFYFSEAMDCFEESKLQDEIEKWLESCIKEKYFGVRNQRFERKLLFLLRNDNAFSYDPLSGFLSFYAQIDLKSIFRHGEKNDKSFFDFVFELVARKMKIHFLKNFNPRHTADICRNGVFTESLCNYFLDCKIENISFFERSKYRQGVAAVNTLIELKKTYDDLIADEELNYERKEIKKEGVLNDADSNKECSKRHKGLLSYQNLIKDFKTAIQVQIVYEIMFYFKKFFYDKESFDFSANQISRIINDFTQWSDDIEYFRYIFLVLNFYVSKKVKDIAFENNETLREFIVKIELIDEILCVVKVGAQDNLKIAVDLLNSIKPSEEYCK